MTLPRGNLEIIARDGWSIVHMDGIENLREQLRRNAVALISLVVAISSLGYNTWRNEATEYNRNQRAISIEVLRHTGQFQQVVFHNAWDMDTSGRGNPRTGWVHVLAIRDLSQILDGEVPVSAQRLYQTWETEWNALGPDNASYRKIIDAIEAVRRDTHELLLDLD